MGINTADFAALAVTIVLFAVIYYLDYKKGVDFGLLTLLGTVLESQLVWDLEIILHMLRFSDVSIPMY